MLREANSGTRKTIKLQNRFPEYDDIDYDDHDHDDADESDDDIDQADHDHDDADEDDDDGDERLLGGRAGEGDDKPGLGGGESSTGQGQCHFQ